MTLRADRVAAALLDGAERPLPAWIRKKQPAKEMLNSRMASIDSQTGSVVNARLSLAASRSDASIETTDTFRMSKLASDSESLSDTAGKNVGEDANVGESIVLDKNNIRKQFKLSLLAARVMHSISIVLHNFLLNRPQL